ncbi:MAG: RND transporter [Paracoccaceae bacterium]|uniref:RND transporter n=1 Tax=Seohaeicola saemankumensis TaxID=481181 RepID=UPI001E502095|nr:RND transporter [Seohaeicola saemankumensis]MCD1627888.1 RND transporter [Seohaeicola saemankumensis]
MTIIDRISWPIVVLLCLTLGLAPFVPEPHIWEKLKMLAAGDLRRPIDIFDLVYHGLPWMLALVKAVRARRQA